MQHLKNKERTGELFIFAEMLIYSAFPIVINYSAKHMPPIFFASLTILTASLALFIYILFTGEVKKIFNKKAFKYVLGITVFIIIIPSILIYKGTIATSGSTTAILLQTEAFFALILAGIFLKEKISKKKILSGLLIVGGALLVLYNGEIKINTGELMILLAAAIYPLGNILAKKALQLTSPAAITFLRSFIGGTILLIFSLFTENLNNPGSYLTQNMIIIIIANGVLVMGLSKIFWYEGLKRMDIGKTTLIAMAYPAISLILAMIFLKEIPTIYQILGLVIIMSGVYFITLKRKTRAGIDEQISA